MVDKGQFFPSVEEKLQLRACSINSSVIRIQLFSMAWSARRWPPALGEQTLPCCCAWLAGTGTHITLCHHKASQLESLKTHQLPATLPAKRRNTGHAVVMALIKQTWQDITDDYFNGLHQSCYKTGKLRLCKEGNQSGTDGLGG